MESSILQSTKKVLGIDSTYEAFDLDVITHINTALATLTQMAIGPLEGFMIEDESATWEDFIGTSGDPAEVDPRFNLIRTYVYLKVSILFDPPVLGYLIDAKNNQIRELEWRLNVLREEVNPPENLYPPEEVIEA
jgi:hypothetical protein